MTRTWRIRESVMKVDERRELPLTTSQETEVDGPKDTVQDWESPKLQQMFEK